MLDLSNKWRRKLFIGGLSLLLIAVAVVLWMPPFGLLVRDRVDAWMRAELEDLAARHLNPSLEIGEIHYDFPFGAELEDVRLVAQSGEPFLKADKLSFSLAELPSEDEPLVIDGIEAEGLVVRLLATEDGGLVGFSEFLKDRGDDEEDEDSAAPVSEVFELRDVEISDARVEYRATPDGKTMVLDDLELELAFDETPRPDTGLWYPVEVTSERGELLRVSLQGALSLDEKAVRIDAAELDLTVDEDTVEALPPGLRELADTHGAHGRLEARAQGRWALVEPTKSALTAQIRLREFGVAIGKWRFPVTSLDASLTTRDGVVRIPGAHAEVLGGQVTGWATLDATGKSQPLQSHWTVEALDVSKLINAAEGGKTDLAGKLSGTADIDLDLARADDSLSGKVDATVSDGRLLILPGLRQLAKLRGKELSGRQRADVKLALHPWGMTINQLDVETSLLGVRANGRAHFDGQLDMQAAIGPLQKADGGPVRDALADAGARLWQYRIGGDASDPRVSPRPLGIGN